MYFQFSVFILKTDFLNHNTAFVSHRNYGAKGYTTVED